MMQFVVFSLLCQLLASATVSAESTFFNEFILDPIASTINELSEDDSFLYSASQKSTQKELLIKDFDSFIVAKGLQLSVTNMKSKKVEMNLTDDQLNEVSKVVTQFAYNAERLAFSTLANRSDPSFVPLRNETQISMDNSLKALQILRKTINNGPMVRESVKAFVETAEIVLDESTQDETEKRPILAKLNDLKKIATPSFVDSMEAEIFDDLCRLDKENTFFQQATKPVVIGMAKLASTIELAKEKHHRDYVVMLEYYYARMSDLFTEIKKNHCHKGVPNFKLVANAKTLPNDPVLGAFQQKMGINSTSLSY